MLVDAGISGPIAELVAEARKYAAAACTDDGSREAMVTTYVWSRSHDLGLNLTYAEVEEAVEEQAA